MLRRARIVIAASAHLADEARALGARDVRVVPTGVSIPHEVATPADPPHVLFAGRLSPEKGIREFLAATQAFPRVIVGAGPVAAPESVGFVGDLAPYYRRAAVVAVPSLREGYGVVAREAMAHGRAVVASGVGGLRDAIDDGVDGLLVPPGDVAALREAIERLLGEEELRNRLGAAAREKARREWSWDAATDALLATYEDALR